MLFGFIGQIRRRRKLRRYREVAGSLDAVLIDTPVHGNIGDQAIALAECELFDAAFGPEGYQELTAADIDHMEGDFASATPLACTVFVHGGGFLGSLWPQEEDRLRRILKAFEGHRVVVLPQTAYFEQSSEAGQRYLEESRLAYEGHPDLTICAREEMTFRLLRSLFPTLEVALVPDVVLSLRIQLPRAAEIPQDEVLLCLRSDKEKVLSEDDLALIKSQIHAALGSVRLVDTDMIVDGNVAQEERKGIILSKLEEFAKAKLVVTDRLHGMVFAALAGTPCVALGNCSGKVKAVYQWIRDLGYVQYIDDAFDIKDALARLEWDHLRRYDASQQFEDLVEAISTFRKD